MVRSPSLNWVEAVNKAERRQRDLEAIERLREQDVAAVKAGDFRALRALMSDEAVVLPPKAPVRRGAHQLDRNYEEMAHSMADVKVLDYSMQMEEVQVFDDHAIEWGTIRGTMQVRGGMIQSTAWKVLRVLRREPEHQWRVYRVIWNELVEGPGDSV